MVQLTGFYANLNGICWAQIENNRNALYNRAFNIYDEALDLERAGNKLFNKAAELERAGQSSFLNINQLFANSLFKYEQAQKKYLQASKDCQKLTDQFPGDAEINTLYHEITTNQENLATAIVETRVIIISRNAMKAFNNAKDFYNKRAYAKAGAGYQESLSLYEQVRTICQDFLGQKPDATAINKQLVQAEADIKETNLRILKAKILETRELGMEEFNYASNLAANKNYPKALEEYTLAQKYFIQSKTACENFLQQIPAENNNLDYRNFSKILNELNSNLDIIASNTERLKAKDNN